jgi:hypothetical protein
MIHSLRKPVSAIVAVVALTISPWAINLSRAGELPVSDNHGAVQATPQQATVSDKPASGKRPLNPRVLFITAKDSPHSDQELARLRRAGGEFDKMKAIGWTIGVGPENMVQIVDRDEVPELVEKLSVKEFPTVACIDHDEVVRYFRWGCTTPLDAWTFGFLAKGIDERPPGAVLEAARVESTGSYPLRGNHWSVEGDWSPTRDKVITHLRGPNHLAQLIPTWHIDDWSLEELRSLHDDLHEKYDTGTYSSSRSSNSSSPASDYLRFKGGHS